MKKVLLFLLIVFTTKNAFAQSDTIAVNASNLNLKDLKTGKFNYLIYTRDSANKPAKRLTMVTINVSKRQHNGAEAIAIEQTWDASDTTDHTAISLLNAKDLSTIQHHYWWKRTGQNIQLDYEKKTAKIEPPMTEAQNEKFMKGFNATLESKAYFLNWHADLTLFPLFPFKENVVLKVKFHDPGIRTPTDEYYKVIKSEKLEGIDCWVLEYTLPQNMGYQRFWIAKEGKEVIKEEDNFKGMFRYKLKMRVSE